MTADIAYLSIAELGAKLRDRSLTSRQLTEIYLERIGRIGTQLNAFITVTADLAREQADRADTELASGHDRGPLHGIPYAVKDLVDTAAIRTTYGCKAFLGRLPTRDAALVTRLRDAGAVLLGKLSMIELANALDNPKMSANHGGPCRNAWAFDRWAGGSSSGAGAATAAGLCAFSIGSETWGSIDCPAAFNGVTGYRPTFGTVQTEGVLILCPTLDKLGALARSAADIATIASVIATPAPEPSTRPLNIGFVSMPAHTPTGYAEATFAAVEVLRAGGATVERVELPELPALATILVILFGEVYGSLAPMIQTGAVHELYDGQPWAEKWAAYERMGIRADDYVKAAYARTVIQRVYRGLFERFDVLFTGGRPVIAPVIDADDFAENESTGFGVVNCVGNLIGAPGITLPSGFSEGLPISMHAMAAPYEDSRLFELGTLVQRSTDHHRKRPPVG